MNKTLFKTKSPEVDESIEMFHSSDNNKKIFLVGSVEQDKKQKK